MSEYISYEMIKKRFPEARASSGEHTEYYVHCPKFHKKGGRWKLSINPETGAFFCHDCGYAGNAHEAFFSLLNDQFKLIRAIRGVEEIKAAELPTGHRIRNYRYKWGDVPAPGECVLINHLPQNHPAVTYMEQRKFDISSFNKEGGFSVLYCTKGQISSPTLGSVEGRIVFPVFYNSKVVGWQARYIDFFEEHNGVPARRVWEGESKGWVIYRKKDGLWEDKDHPKYWTCPDMSRSSTLYNIDRARAFNFCVLVEGPLDVIRIGSYGVGTFGKVITFDQMRMIKAIWKTVILLQDDDVVLEKDPQKKLRYNKMIAELSTGIRLIAFPLKGYHDAGECPTEEIYKQIRENLNGDDTKRLGLSSS